jgi:hypothetical protein
VQRIEAAAGPLGLEDELQVGERELRWERGDQVLLASAAAHTGKVEPLEGALARLGGLAHSAQEVTERLGEAIRTQQPTRGGEGFSLLLLRRA